MTHVDVVAPLLPLASGHGIKQELDPIVRHGVVIIFLSLVSAGFAFVAEIIKSFLPMMKTAMENFERIDAITALTLVVIFGFYTVLIVLVRLFRSLRDELKAHVRVSKSSIDDPRG
jgi:hypothetical protein